MSTIASRRRSARIHSNLHHGGTTNSMMGRPRSAVIRGHGNNSNTNTRLSGRKRPQPDSSDGESSDGDGSSGSDEDSEFETTSNSNNRNSNNRYSQVSNLNTQPSQQSKRRKLQYRAGRSKGKWQQTQTNVQRRSTRLKYRKLADETTLHRAAIVDPMSNKFMDKLEEQNKIYEDVCHPNEAFMDIEQAKNMTNILKEQTRTLANEQFSIKPPDYIDKVIETYGFRPSSSQMHDENTRFKVDWSKIGNKNAPWFFTVPPIQFMNGPLQQCEQVAVEKKKPRQVRQKKTFTTDAPVIQPKKVVKQKKRDKTETKSRVMHLKKILRKTCEKSSQGVNPFQFLINPESYSQTIENLFDMSFIMKEGFAQMDLDRSSQQPTLTYISPAERTRRHNLSKEKSNGQCIVKFNPSTFCHLIDAYDITESQIERADGGKPDSDESDDEDDGDDGDNDGDTESEDGEERKSGSEDDYDEDDDIQNSRNNGRKRASKRRVIRNRKGNDKEEAD